MGILAHKTPHFKVSPSNIDFTCKIDFRNEFGRQNRFFGRFFEYFVGVRLLHSAHSSPHFTSASPTWGVPPPDPPTHNHLLIISGLRPPFFFFHGGNLRFPPNPPPLIRAKKLARSPAEAYKFVPNFTACYYFWLLLKRASLASKSKICKIFVKKVK